MQQLIGLLTDHTYILVISYIVGYKHTHMYVFCVSSIVILFTDNKLVAIATSYSLG